MEAETEEQGKVTLFNTEGTSDKVYVTWIESREGGFVVLAQWGRRGGPMQSGAKSKVVTIEKAKAAFDKVLKSKLAKGYRTGKDVPAYSQVEGAVDTGIRPMLLTAATEDDLERFVSDDSWGAQEKKNGKHVLVKSGQGKATGINRRGLECAIPEAVADTLREYPLVLDGELIDHVFHVFDILEDGEGEGSDVQSESTLARHVRLKAAIAPFEGVHVKVVPLVLNKDKRGLVAELRNGRKEGVVFKLLSAPYQAGKIETLSKAVAVKIKFWKGGEFVVDEINDQQSVRLVAFDGKNPVVVGNCTVPSKYLGQVKKGCVLRVKYLYATSGKQLYQPSLDPDDSGSVVREDKLPRECGIDQLHFEGKE